MTVDLKIIIDFYWKSILIQVTTFFIYRFLSIDIENRYSSMIVIDYYWLLVYRLSTSGIITEQRNLIIFFWYLNVHVPVMIAFLAYSSVFVMDTLFQDKVLVLSTFGKKLSSWFFHFICYIKAGKLYLKGNTFGAYNLQTASGEFHQYRD